MITKEGFIKLMECWKKMNKISDSLSDLHIDILNSDLYEIPSEIVDLYLNEFFTSEGVDLIYWWMFEDVDKIIYYEDKSKEDLTTLESFWEYLTCNKNIYIKS